MSVRDARELLEAGGALWAAQPRKKSEVERLTAQLQAAQAEAWDKGYAAAQEDDDVNAWITTDNPYRASIEQTEANRG